MSLEFGHNNLALTLLLLLNKNKITLSAINTILDSIL